jgi:hypothetical protein
MIYNAIMTVTEDVVENTRDPSIFQYLPEETEKNHGKPVRVKLEPPKYE